MKRIAIRALLIVALTLISLAAFIQFRFTHLMNAPHELPQVAIEREVAGANIELGKRIYHVRNGCVDCHGTDLSGKMVMDNGPMGSIFGANITPYKLSTWTNEEVARAIRYGIHKSGRSLHFMPSFDFEGLSLGDTAALIAYLRSVPAVNRESHVNVFGPIAKTLAVLGQMPVMFPAFAVDAKKPFAEKPKEEASLEFGRYLARSCAGCHGPDLRGGKIPGGDPAWPESSDLHLGASSFWTEEKFRTLIRTGVSPRTNKALQAPMPIALLQQMNEIEIGALWQYLGSLK